VHDISCTRDIFTVYHLILLNNPSSILLLHFRADRLALNTHVGNITPSLGPGEGGSEVWELYAIFHWSLSGLNTPLSIDQVSSFLCTLLYSSQFVFPKLRQEIYFIFHGAQSKKSSKWMLQKTKSTQYSSQRRGLAFGSAWTEALADLFLIDTKEHPRLKVTLQSDWC
jgi:hypothetical protein